jgi:hypothetical protein
MTAVESFPRICGTNDFVEEVGGRICSFASAIRFEYAPTLISLAVTPGSFNSYVSLSYERVRCTVNTKCSHGCEQLERNGRTMMVL